MEALQAVFPANDFLLLAVIVTLPLLGAFVNGVFGKRLGQQAVSLMALAMVGGAFLLSVVAFFLLREAQADGTAARFFWHGWTWMELSARGEGGPVPIEFALSIDALSGTMALVVTGVGFLIHLYSTKYMENDPSYHRFFAYLNLFIFSMLVLILGDNLPVLFVGWEGVGLCSYLLIGFWFEDEKNAAAGKKAFITNRIGDFGLLVAMGLLVYYVGALDWTSFSGDSLAAGLAQPVRIWPIGNGGQFWNEPVYVNGATLVALALFLGAAGKSAQIPLYVWLPDAMAGPTPVSALIHAATMVTAGVYLLCRMAGVFVLSPVAMLTVAFVGAATALFAATIAVVQKDIKKVLAYSTVSQLGYMFLGVGVGAFAAGFFHVITHAFFKACLFLGAGSVIHAMHARIHDTDASQDMQNMGGLRKFLPWTFATFVASWAAIVAVPFTSGFFSKDEILFKAFTSKVVPPTMDGKIGFGPREIEIVTWPDWAPTVLYAMGVLGAVLTAFYMSRLVIGIFFGKFRGWAIEAPSAGSVHGPADASAAHQSSDDGDAHGDEQVSHRKGPPPHESPWQMTLPLAILGGLALVGGVFNAHAFFHHAPLDEWLAPVFGTASRHVEEVEGAESLAMVLLIPGLLAFIVGVGTAAWIYLSQGGRPSTALKRRFPALYALVYDKWRIDELYESTILGAIDLIADLCAWFDKWIVDGVVARLTAFVITASGSILRYAQAGRAHTYAAVMVVGLLVSGWFLLTPQARIRADANDQSGVYKLAAAPGFGYSYRWDLDGDGNFDQVEFDAVRDVEVALERNQSRTIALEVRNAFGRTTQRELLLSRPHEDKSGPPGAGDVTRIDVNRRPDGSLFGILPALNQPPGGGSAPSGQAPQGGDQ